MDQYKILALDETGKASFKHSSSTFILSGLIISENFLPKFEKRIKRIKSKFFNNEDIIFHSRDMLRKKGPFSILRDTNIFKKFWSEYINSINISDVSMALIVVDKEKAKKLGWNDIAILKRVYLKMLEEFSKKYLKEDKKGKLLVESDPYQDKYLLQAHNKLQKIGIPSEGMTGSEYRNKITSISLVNKLNLDSHIQIADSFAIMGSMFYKFKMNKKVKLTQVEKMFKQLIDSKINNKTNPGIFEILV